MNRECIFFSFFFQSQFNRNNILKFELRSYGILSHTLNSSCLIVKCNNAYIITIVNCEYVRTNLHQRAKYVPTNDVIYF